MKVNGKEYPMWGQFVERQDEWIGGILDDSGDTMDRSLNLGNARTLITGIVLRPNGTDSAYFEILGKDFGCGFDVRHGGISGGVNSNSTERSNTEDKDGWLTFSGYGGHSFRIHKPVKAEPITAIKLTGAEISSGLNRVKGAEGLILQLPVKHDGRNTWLMNYGVGKEAIKLREKHGVKWLEETLSAETRG